MSGFSAPLVMVYDMENHCEVPLECIKYAEQGVCIQTENYHALRYFRNNLFITSKVTIFPLRKVVMENKELDFMICYLVKGQLTVQSNTLKAGDFFIVPQNIEFFMHNRLEEEATVIITQLQLCPETN